MVYFDENQGAGYVLYEGKGVTVVDQASAPEDETPEHFQSILREGIEQIGRFVTTFEFQALLEKMYSLPKEERPAFVSDVILNPKQRGERGITAAHGRAYTSCVNEFLTEMFTL